MAFILALRFFPNKIFDHATRIMDPHGNLKGSTNSLDNNQLHTNAAPTRFRCHPQG